MRLKGAAFLVITGLILSIALFGCGKKHETAEELQEPMTMASLTNMTAETGAKAVNVPAPAAPAPAEKIAPEAAPAAPAHAVAQQGEATTPPNLEPLPPSGPYKPSMTEIQTALKNAGMYSGTVDGKIGPLTKKAIEEFQKANNLKVDGKVGPQTWDLLSKHLVAETPAPVAKKKKR